MAITTVTLADVGVLVATWAVLATLYLLIHSHFIVKNRKVLEDRFTTEKKDINARFDTIKSAVDKTSTEFNSELKVLRSRLPNTETLENKLVLIDEQIVGMESSYNEAMVNITKAIDSTNATVEAIEGSQRDVLTERFNSLLDASHKQMDEFGGEVVGHINELRTSLVPAITGAVSGDPSVRATKEMAKTQKELQQKALMVQNAIKSAAEDPGSASLTFKIDRARDAGLIKKGGFFDKLGQGISFLQEMGGIEGVKNDIQALHQQFDSEIGNGTGAYNSGTNQVQVRRIGNG